MEKDLHKPPYEPVNATEHFLYAMLVRLDALCHMMNSLIEYVAERDNVATTSHEVKEEVVQSDEEVVQPDEKEEAPKRTRKTRSKKE